MTAKQILKRLAAGPAYLTGYGIGKLGFESTYLNLTSENRLTNANLLVRVLARCFEYYSVRDAAVRREDFKGNEEFQREYWSKYPLYYKSKRLENYDNDYYRTFDRLFAGAAAQPEIRRCLDIGCGSFSHILRLASRWPDLKFIGVDISKYSADAYEESIRRFGIGFVSGSITDHLELLDEIDLFYTFGVLMYCSPGELERLLEALKNTPRLIRGIIVEPLFEGAAGELDKDLGSEFRHDFVAYFNRYGFPVHQVVKREHWKEKNYPMLFAYFSNRPDSAASSV